MNRSVKRLAGTALAATALSVGALAVAAAPAEASVTDCNGGRCTIYLSKSETRDLGMFKAPPIAPYAPVQIKVAYGAAILGHSWFAKQYANQGMCSGFRLSIYPWESQGYFGYRCNWN